MRLIMGLCDHTLHYVRLKQSCGEWRNTQDMHASAVSVSMSSESWQEVMCINPIAYRCWSCCERSCFRAAIACMAARICTTNRQLSAATDLSGKAHASYLLLLLLLLLLLSCCMRRHSGTGNTAFGTGGGNCIGLPLLPLPRFAPTRLPIVLLAFTAGMST